VSGPPRDVIRVLLVDDHSVFRLGLKALLATAPDIEVVGEASDGEEALRLCARLKPDVAIMDLTMSGMDGVAATRRLAQERSETRVLVLTMHEEESYLIPLLEAGAAGYLVKSAAGRELVDALRAVAAGDVFVRPAAASVLAKGWTRRATRGEAQAIYVTLSERERDVLTWFAQGYTSAQIGERLRISPKTVDTYRRRIAEKTGLSERADYVKLALELGLLSPSR
jgi:two-component system, NarL family, response regulator NreC